jgi:hypothetical protein
MKRLLLVFTALMAVPALADPAQVEAVTLTQRAGAWTVSVTISHRDTGWDDYADGWRVETPGGKILGTRVLHHPHVEEQPFTRSLGGLSLPDDVTEIVVRTRTTVTGWADDVSVQVQVPVPADG